MIYSPKWSIRSLVTLKKWKKYIHGRLLQDPLNFFNAMKKIAIFMIFNDYLGHFRGVSLVIFFLFEPLFLSYRTKNLQINDFL